MKPNNFLIEKVTSAHTRRGAYATFRFESENIQICLASSADAQELNETSAFLLLIRSHSLLEKKILPRSIHAEQVDKTLGLFNQVLIDEMHATDVQLLTRSEAESLKEFH